MKIPTTDIVTTTISQALGYPSDTPIRRLKAKVALVWERKMGAGKRGPWTKQSGLIEENGNKMVFTLWSYGDISNAKGKEITFLAPENRKSALVLENDYKDPTKRSLKVDGRQCSVFIDGITEVVPEDDIPGLEKQSPKVEPEIEHPAVSAAKNVSSLMGMNGAQDGVEHARRYAMQMANLRKIADGAAKFAANGHGYDDNHVKDIGTSFWIEMVRKGFVDQMPNNHPIETKKPKEEPELHEEEQPF